MSRLRPDFASGKLSNTSITIAQSQLSSNQFPTLPVVAAPDVIELVLDPYAVYGAPERVIVTSYAGTPATVLTVTRGAYGSTARAHNVNGVQEDWCAAITDQDFYHSTLYNLSNDDHTQYLNAGRHQAAGAHAFTTIQNDIFSGTYSTANIQAGVFNRLVHGRRHQAGAWTTPGAGTYTVNFDTQDWDAGAGFNGSPSIFSPANAGFYSVKASVSVFSSAADQAIQIFLAVNGNEVSPGNSSISVAGSQILTSVLSDTINLGSSYEDLTILAYFSTVGLSGETGVDAPFFAVDGIGF